MKKRVKVDPEGRRQFMTDAGKLALYTSPAVIALMKPGVNAIAQSAGGFPGGHLSDNDIPFSVLPAIPVREIQEMGASMGSFDIRWRLGDGSFLDQTYNYGSDIDQFDGIFEGHNPPPPPVPGAVIQSFDNVGSMWDDFPEAGDYFLRYDDQNQLIGLNFMLEPYVNWSGSVKDGDVPYYLDSVPVQDFEFRGSDLHIFRTLSDGSRVVNGDWVGRNEDPAEVSFGVSARAYN